MRPVLMSIAKIIYVFYRHKRATNEFFQSNGSINRNAYCRALALGLTLASVDALLLAPTAIIAVAVNAELIASSRGLFPSFYAGWDLVHSDWAPISIPYSFLMSRGFWPMLDQYLQIWTSPAFALVTFALFGLTLEARATYLRGMNSLGKMFGLAPSVDIHTGVRVSRIEFGSRSSSTTQFQSL
jgi:hypothetical protein